MFNYSLFSLLRGAVFPHRLSFGLVLNRRALAATALSETYNIPVVKKIQSIYCFFWNINSMGSRKLELEIMYQNAIYIIFLDITKFTDFR